jgi:ABC-type nitrate/sulfonate/bicarbonate transport system permease component
VVAQSRSLADRGPARRRHPPTERGRGVAIASEPLVFGIIGFVVVLALWEAVVGLGLVRASLLSSPTRIVAAAIADTRSGLIWPHIRVSLLEWSVGYALAIAAGIPLGLLLGVFRRLEFVVDPWLSALYATPTVALVPLIILLFGVDIYSKFAVVFLEGFITLTVSTITGAHAADKRHLETAQSFRASRWLTFRSVTLPSSVPFILTGLRIAAGRCLVGVVVAEFIAANIGLGFYISLNGTTLNASRVMFGILLIGLFGIAVGQLLRRIERRFEVWRPAIN